MNFRQLFTVMVLFMFLPLLGFGASPIFVEDTTNFPNPERGYFFTTTGSVSATDLRNARAKGMTLVKKYYNIVSYASSDNIPQTFLDNIVKEAQVIRQNGAKLIPRFYYNCGGCPTTTDTRILQHIEDVTKVLRENSDVIAYMELGFLGMCGEWHCGGGSISTKDMRQAVVNKLLAGVPDKMFGMRYNRFKRDLYGNTPLSPDSAFSGSNRARLGAYNDCFMYNETDRGTYDDALTNMSIEDQKTYLNLDNRYVPQGGESCDNASYGTCPVTLADLKRMHWDALNSTFYKPLIEEWEKQGCNADIKKLLGYRLKVVSAQLQDSVQPGKLFSTNLKLVNLGWGKIYNYRSAELVLRNTQTKSKTILKINTDLRQWTKTDSISVNLSAVVPANLPEGPYSVYLNFPDTSSKLNKNPEYSIRLANQNVWEDSTGYNSMLHTVYVSKLASTGTEHYYKKPWGFTLKASQNQGIYMIEVKSPHTGEADFEILTLNGKVVYKEQFVLTSNKKRIVNWKPPIASIYLVRLKQGNHTQTIYTKI